MKHLKVEYNNIVLFDGEVEEVNWSDSPNGVTVTGKVRASAAAGSGGGFLDFLTAASRRQTEAVANQKKAELAAETASEIIE